MSHPKHPASLPLFVVLFLMLASSQACTDDILMLLITSEEPVGPNCMYGGVSIQVGRDVNQNRQLDADEVEQTSYACNARVDGLTSVTRLEPLEPGDLCTYGGLELLYGLDRNEDRQLSNDEVDSRGYVCRGDDGFDSLLSLSNLEPDPNGVCYFGGTRIDSGVDQNRDGVLSPSEITSTEVVCAVHVNENKTLVNNSLENPGANCEFGGIMVEVGYDTNGDNVLAPAEVQHLGYVCNQIVLVAGKSSLIQVLPAGTACAAGGHRMNIGLDENYNGTLESNEIKVSALVCNGEDGLSTLLRAEPYQGSECGSNTGVRWRSGQDKNANGELDSDEVLHTMVVCDGNSGLNSLIALDNNPSQCAGPGYSIEVGVDENDDGYLNSNEVIDSTTICYE